MHVLLHSVFVARRSIFLAWTTLLLGFGITVAVCAPSVAKRLHDNATAPDAFAQGALNTILGDLTQEIAAGSNAAFVGSTTIYTPKVPATAVPALVGSNGMDGLENLLKRSAYGQPFYPAENYGFGASNRAANVSSITSSVNGLAVLPARWNKGLLLSKAAASSDTDLTPIHAGAILPDWVLVARDGSNPNIWNANLQASDSNATSVVGRYAYTIYDEGGLLDMSVAGHPASADARQVSYKGSLASADLTQVSLTQSQVDAIANWRGSHAFAGRQDLIALLTQSVATDSASRANLQNALRFLGTFSRGLSQPSYAPVSRAAATNPRPLILPSSNITDPTKGGGNNVGDAYTSGAAQDALSPSFLGLRAEAAFVRNDGTTPAVTGEPLVKNRFALQRLAWLTYLGPSATRSIPTSDPGVDTPNYDLWQLVNNDGISRDYLTLGTADNIKRYFGLEWDATNHRWQYDLHNRGGSAAGNVSGAMGVIRQLQEVADLKTREPDFFELLKASVDPGSLGKASILSATADLTEGSSSGGAGSPLAPLNFQFYRDTAYDAAIMQLGANIIDQFDADGYPTRIVLDDGGGRGPREFRGVENLPYIYRVRNGILRVREPVPEGSATSYGAGKRNTSDPANDGCTPELHAGAMPSNYVATYPPRPLQDTGVGILLAIPDIWNPHDQNSSMGSPRPGLTGGSFRVIASSATPDAVDSNSSYSTLTVGGRVLSNSSMGRYKGASNQPVSSGGGGTVTPGSVPPNAPAGYNAPVPIFSRTPTSGGAAGIAMSGSNGGYNSPQIICSVPVTGSATATSSILSFAVPDATLFREPTLLAKPDTTTGSGLSMSISNPDVTQLVGDSGNVWTGTGLKGSVKTTGTTNPLTQPTAPAVDQPYIGLYLGAFPLRWVGSRWSGGPYVAPSTSYWVYTDGYAAALGGPGASVTYSLQCQDAFGSWVSYDEKYVNTDVTWQWAPGGLLMDNTTGTFAFVDPRTSRFGAPDDQYAAFDSPHYHAPTSATWLDSTPGVITTERPDIHAGFGLNMRGTYGTGVDWGNWTAAGWHYKNVYSGGVNSMFVETGLFAQNDPTSGSDGLRYLGDSPGAGASDAQFYTDPDGVVRRGTGAYVGSNTGSLGQPLATASAYAGGKATALSQSASRPKMLNRPFRSVAELGYVFSGTPWKNLDFSTPESGYSELLDVFCVNEPNDSSGLVAGKLNLNTRQSPVLAAVLAGATIGESGSSATPTLLAASDATDIANLLVKRTAVGPASIGHQQPLTNVGDLVGRWVSRQALSGNYTPALYPTHNIDGSKAYDGFSADIGTTVSTSLAATNPMVSPIAAQRETAVRALVNVGNTRVWNLLIDVIAQTGEYTQAATGLDQFTVEGSQRYWLHVAIDRMTGAIVDQSLEAVPEIAPTDLTLTSTTVPESQPAGTAVGTLGAVDPNPTSVFTYALVGGTGSGDNGSFTISGNVLKTNAAFRYLDKSSYSVRVREVDQDGMSFEKTLTLAVTPSAYTQWKIANFGNNANDPTVAGNLVDADGDGIVNLLEYALGTSPLASNTTGITLRRVGETVQLNYTRRSATTDVTAHVYWNSDLANPDGWSTSGVTETMLSDDGTLQHWQATVAVSSGARAFMRLQVTSP